MFIKMLIVTFSSMLPINIEREPSLTFLDVKYNGFANTRLRV